MPCCCTERGDLGELGRLQRRAGRVRGRRHHQTVESQIGDHRNRWLVTGLRATRQIDDLTPQRLQDVPVRGVAGASEPDPITGVEGRQEGQQETRRTSRS